MASPSLNTNYCAARKTNYDAQTICAPSIIKSNHAISVVDQTQRRTATPFTMTVLHATGGLRTTTAPAGPAQPARTTPRAQTTALASDTAKNVIAANMKAPIKIETASRIMNSSMFKSDFGKLGLRSYLRASLPADIATNGRIAAARPWRRRQARD
jgi:hypothetical protein